MSTKMACVVGHIGRDARIWWIADYYRKAMPILDLVDRLRLCASAGIAKSISPVKSWAGSSALVRYSSRPLLAAEPVASFVELQADLHVRNRVRRHQKLIARGDAEVDVLGRIRSTALPCRCHGDPDFAHFSTSVLWITSMTSTRNVPVPVAGSRIWTKS